MDQLIYNEDITKDFLRHLAKAYSKHQKNKNTKKNLDKHINKVKDLFLDKKTSKKKITQEFQKLEKQIENVIALEKGILAKHEEQNINKEVKQRIKELEKKFNKYTALIEGRQEKIKRLEKKITKKTSEKPKITDTQKTELRNLLYDLEEKYDDLKAKGVPQKKLKTIKDKIKKLKAKV